MIPRVTNLRRAHQRDTRRDPIELPTAGNVVAVVSVKYFTVGMLGAVGTAVRLVKRRVATATDIPFVLPVASRMIGVSSFL